MSIIDLAFDIYQLLIKSSRKKGNLVLGEGLAPPEAFRPRGLQPRAIAALPTQLEPTAGFEPAT